jgi:hypothetical protein
LSLAAIQLEYLVVFLVEEPELQHLLLEFGELDGSVAFEVDGGLFDDGSAFHVLADGYDVDLVRINNMHIPYQIIGRLTVVLDANALAPSKHTDLHHVSVECDIFVCNTFALGIYQLEIDGLQVDNVSRLFGLS